MAPQRRPEIVIGLDVGKSSHWACIAARNDEVLASKSVANTRHAPHPSASPDPAQHTAQAKLKSTPAQTKRGAHRRQPTHPSIQSGRASRLCRESKG